MTVKGHVILASALVYLPISIAIQEYPIYVVLMAYLIVMFGAIFPDIDEPNSYIGKRTFYLSELFRVMGLKHRGFTHWLIVPLLISLIGYLVQDRLYSLILYSFAFGILAHDIGDLITRGGIYGFFFPFFRKTKIVALPSIFRFQTFSFSEMIVIFILFATNGYLYYGLLVTLV